MGPKEDQSGMPVDDLIDRQLENAMLAQRCLSDIRFTMTRLGPNYARQGPQPIHLPANVFGLLSDPIIAATVCRDGTDNIANDAGFIPLRKLFASFVRVSERLTFKIEDPEVRRGVFRQLAVDFMLRRRSEPDETVQDSIGHVLLSDRMSSFELSETPTRRMMSTDWGIRDPRHKVALRRANELMATTRNLAAWIAELEPQFPMDKLQEAAKTHHRIMSEIGIPYTYACVHSGAYFFPLAQVCYIANRLMRPSQLDSLDLQNAIDHMAQHDFSNGRVTQTLHNASRRVDRWQGKLPNRLSSTAFYDGQRDIDILTVGLPIEAVRKFRELTEDVIRGSPESRYIGLPAIPLDFSKHITKEELQSGDFVYADDLNRIPGFNIHSNPANRKTGRHLAGLYFYLTASLPTGVDAVSSSTSAYMRSVDQTAIAHRVQNLPTKHLGQFNRALRWLIGFHMDRVLNPEERRTYDSFLQYDQKFDRGD